MHSEIHNAVCDDDRGRVYALLKVAPAAANVRTKCSAQTPLTYAAHHGRVTLARALLKARAEASNVRVATELLMARADVSAVDAQCRSALQHAALAPAERRARVEELLQVGVCPEADLCTPSMPA